MKILVVDDSMMVRKSMKTLLEKLGHSVILANNGKEAIDRYKENKPDIVTMDLTMPIMDGMEALRVLIRIDPHVKVIMSTANGFSDLVLLAMKEGALGYILKPITIEILKDAIDKLFVDTEEEE